MYTKTVEVTNNEVLHRLELVYMYDDNKHSSATYITYNMLKDPELMKTVLQRIIDHAIKEKQGPVPGSKVEQGTT